MLLVLGMFVASGCGDSVPAGDRQVVVNELSDVAGNVTECLRFTLDPRSDDLTVEIGGEFLAIRETSIDVRLGEPDAVEWAEIGYDLLAPEWQFVVDQRAAVGGEIFGQKGRDFKVATSSELAWLRLGCNVDPQSSALVQVTGQYIYVYFEEHGARGFQVVPDGGRWEAPTPLVALEDMDSSEMAELRTVAASLSLVSDGPGSRLP